ncbi:uncharacterized protein FOMMEDRAFT_150007 [Fomitiporia mediterranea MF3/22]|uniref:uncharacterized protein n=1 Tax=Fomitiporia mediterranea (strain MF3/22) TaxID=694068 RepID=UPI0004409BCC|nr:uncharacterized protein FOMMEDRAFT_150007 [Fomitiporia mediterranea MF3/22]EJD07476.1 hypothetical protein FOMMEDRAFT_150007 [Fomitiporia mediterranea MF3/22]
MPYVLSFASHQNRTVTGSYPIPGQWNAPMQMDVYRITAFSAWGWEKLQRRRGK